MSVMKEMQFPVSVRWRGGRLAHADADGKERASAGDAAGVPRWPRWPLEP